MNLDLELRRNLKKHFSNVKLSNYSWFNLGGPSEHLFKPNSKEQLIQFLKVNKKNNLDITILGAGSNTLIRDNGVKGAVIKLGSNFSNINLLDKNTIEIRRAILDRKISNFAKENAIGNLDIFILYSRLNRWSRDNE